MFNRFIKDDSGVLTFEWILLVTILVIGVIAGLAAVRDALTVELADIAQAVGNVNQSYSYYGLETTTPIQVEGEGEGVNSTSYVVGSEYNDGASTVTVQATTN